MVLNVSIKLTSFYQNDHNADMLMIGYCGNGFGAGSVKANETDCNYLCPGNVAEFCGKTTSHVEIAHNY